jgi:hypothetical protein
VTPSGTHGASERSVVPCGCPKFVADENGDCEECGGHYCLPHLSHAPESGEDAELCDELLEAAKWMHGGRMPNCAFRAAARIAALSGRVKALEGIEQRAKSVVERTREFAWEHIADGSRVGATAHFILKGDPQ